jgi:hypothetical protein
MDRQGKLVIKPKFYWAQNFHEGRARVWMGKKGGFIDSTGKLVFEMPNGSGTSRFAQVLPRLRCHRFHSARNVCGGAGKPRCLPVIIRLGGAHDPRKVAFHVKDPSNLLV